MGKAQTTSRFGEDGHPTEGALILHVEGELPAKDAAGVGSHLEACWSCRARAEKIQEATFLFVAYRDYVLTPLVGPAPSGEQGFDGKLRRLAAEAGRKPFITRLRSSFGKLLLAARPSAAPRPWAFGAAALAAVVLLVSVLRFGADATVSAGELLARASDARAAQLHAEPQPVVYQKIQVRRKKQSSPREETASLDLWSDTTNARSRRSVDDPNGRRFEKATGGRGSGSARDAAGPAAPDVLGDLEQVFRANNMDPNQPLSPASYQAWRNSLGNKEERVTRYERADDRDALRLQTTAVGAIGVGRIAEASLVVRTRDWHPIEQHLKVIGTDGVESYHLTEVAFEVLPLKNLPPTVFGDAEASSPPPAAVSAVPSPTPAATPAASPRAPAPALPGPAELEAAEVGARYAIHRAQADLGEPVEIFRTASGLVGVRALVESASRKQELLEALRGVPHLSVDIRTVEEAARAAEATRSQSATVPTTPDVNAGRHYSVSEQSADDPLQEKLRRYFGAQPGDVAVSREGERAELRASDVRMKIVRLSNEAVSLSRAAMAEAWALRRLAERYAPGAADQLSTADRRRLAEIVRAHVVNLRGHARKLRGLIEPPLSSASGAKAASATGGAGAPRDAAKSDWAADSLSVFKTTQQVNRLTRDLFAGAGHSGGQSPESAINQLLAGFPQLEEELRRLEREVPEE